jgi:hypothetical protein
MSIGSAADVQFADAKTSVSANKLMLMNLLISITFLLSIAERYDKTALSLSKTATNIQ